MKLSARNREKWKKPILLITLIVHSSNKTNTFVDWFWFNQRVFWSYNILKRVLYIITLNVIFVH